MKKLKLFIDVEKEEKYLEEMAENGYVMKNYNCVGIYTFDKTEPVNLNYRIDYRIFKNKTDFEQYRTLFEDAGWKHISGTYFSGAQFFLPESKDMKLKDIFSSAESKAEIYKRFLSQSCVGFALMVIYIMLVFTSYEFSFQGFGYLTPGLWIKSGMEFWKAILFETPFMLLRVLPLLFLVGITFTYGYWAIKAQTLYKKSIYETDKM